MEKAASSGLSPDDEIVDLVGIHPLCCGLAICLILHIRRRRAY